MALLSFVLAFASDLWSSGPCCLLTQLSAFLRQQGQHRTTFHPKLFLNCSLNPLFSVLARTPVSCYSHFSTCTSCTSCTQTVTGSGTFQTFPRPGTKIPQRGINKTWRFLGIAPCKMTVAVAVVPGCKKCRKCNFFFYFLSLRARELLNDSHNSQDRI